MSLHLDNFSNHCKCYFERSLQITNDASKPKDCEEYQSSVVVLELLEHQLINVNEESQTDEYAQFLISDKVKKFSHQLQSCGLLTQVEENDPSIKRNHVLDHQTLAKYTQIRDSERRKAHQLQMEERKLYLGKLIQSKLKTSLELTPSTTHPTKEKDDANLFSHDFLKNVRKKAKSFCSNHIGSIGTHSFIGGVKKMIETQISSKEVIIWTFNGSILTESALSSIESNHEQYINEAIELLNSFMVFNTNEDRVENAKVQKNESLFSFHINASISNASLRYILSEFPSASDLHAKPAGTFGPIPGASEKRKNIDGKLDEYVSFISCNQGLRCEIL